MLDKLSQFGALPKPERYVHEGKLITATGMSAGMDMALYLASLVASEDYAKMLQLVTEYYPQPPVNIPDLSAVPKQIEADARAFLKEQILKMSNSISVLN
jgi:transcriptional regulator GlxA family with amidase domain